MNPNLDELEHTDALNHEEREENNIGRLCMDGPQNVDMTDSGTESTMTRSRFLPQLFQ
jgi:hypothetical protein